MLPHRITSIARWALWNSPPLYRVYRRFRFGDFRNADSDSDYWVAGYPRSSNTFTAQCLSIAARDAKVAKHLHVPSMVIPAWRSGKPGIFVIREPRSAAISWSIYHNQSLDWSLRYYIDFHRFLLPIQTELFVAPFRQTTRRIDLVLVRFAECFDLKLEPVALNESFVSERFTEIEQYWQAPDKPVNERQVARPSKVRSGMTAAYDSLIQKSRALQARLRDAEEVYGLFTKPNRFTEVGAVSRQSAGKTTQLLA